MSSARALYDDALVWDNHGCLPYERTEAFVGEIDRYRRAGVDVAIINIGDAQEPLETLMRMAAHIRHFVASHPERFVLATSVAAILGAKAVGKLAVGLDVEGVYALGTQLSLISLYYDLGVRWMLMVYNRENLAGAGVHDDNDGGLTPFGREICREMDRVGMVKCCTHTGYRTAMDVLTTTERPTIFSHSNPRALRDHPRNITDDMIRACARTRGVVCISGVGIFLGDNDIRPSTYAQHVEYVANLVGVDHVGIGLDYVFDQTDMDVMLAQQAHLWPPGYGYDAGIQFLAPEALPEVAEDLLRRNFTEADVRKVLGGNLLRVASEVWK